MVKRWDTDPYAYAADLHEADDGEWVRYEDYDILEKKYGLALMGVDSFKSMYRQACKERDEQAALKNSHAALSIRILEDVTDGGWTKVEQPEPDKETD